MKWLISMTAAALLSCSVAVETFRMKEDVLIECFNVIACELGKVAEIQGVASTGSQKSAEYVRGVLKKYFEMPESEDLFTESVTDHYCRQSDHTKNEWFTDISKQLIEFWGITCEKGDEVECKAIEHTTLLFSEMLGGYYARGECGPANIAKKMLFG